MQWMSTPSILVVNCGKAFNFASALCQSVVRPPVVDEFLELRERHALRGVVDGLALGPARSRNAPAEVDECLFRHADVEGADGSCGGGRQRVALSHDGHRAQ